LADSREDESMSDVLAQLAADKAARAPQTQTVVELWKSGLPYKVNATTGIAAITPTYFVSYGDVHYTEQKIDKQAEYEEGSVKNANEYALVYVDANETIVTTFDRSFSDWENAVGRNITTDGDTPSPKANPDLPDIYPEYTVTEETPVKIAVDGVIFTVDIDWAHNSSSVKYFQVGEKSIGMANLRRSYPLSFAYSYAEVGPNKEEEITTEAVDEATGPLETWRYGYARVSDIPGPDGVDLFCWQDTRLIRETVTYEEDL
jgi:hypothetical protein